MFAFDLGAQELIILLIVVLVLFGGSQLPKLAKNLGQAQKQFKEGLAEGQRADMSEAERKAAELRAAEARVAELRAEQGKTES